MGTPRLRPGYALRAAVHLIWLGQLVVLVLDCSSGEIPLGTMGAFLLSIMLLIGIRFDTANAYLVRKSVKLCVLLLITIFVAAFVLGVVSERETRAALGEVEEALETYRLANGHYPEQIEELVPGYVDSLPNLTRCGCFQRRYKYSTRGGVDYSLQSPGGLMLRGYYGSTRYRRAVPGQRK